MANTPSAGLKDITFPINMANAAHKSGYYYAMQYGFVGLSDIGYTGIQPRPDNAQGQSVVHGVFSSFVNGTTTSDANCHLGADNGPGVSCAVEIAVSSGYAHTYKFEVRNAGGTTWVGTMIDALTGVRTHIGSWTLPAGSGGIESSQLGFVEYYLWNDKQNHPCNTLPKTQVFFGTPTTKTSGAGPGKLGTPYEYGNCVGQVGFSTTTSASGASVTVGVANPATGAVAGIGESEEQVVIA
ncbi:hypothetical protein EIP86_007058 [Pleurotus ostreatoroseus]|nr:hypothetical protein EIP86_007058 [Pleurotus ostreatoroseus]